MHYADKRIRAAYAECRRLARRHYENFPVASYFVPRDKRDALAAIYAFARHADDLADEPGVEGRLEKIAAWREMLRECYSGKVHHPVFLALHDSVQRFSLSFENLANLLRAFESDVNTNRHRDFPSLLAYCACSANPVGRLVLELFGHRDLELFVLSDCVCTALQLTNFWQDVAVDLDRDRIYLPLEDLQRFNYTLDDLRAGRVDDRWRELLKLEIARTRQFFDQGKALPERVAQQLRVQLRLTWLGGMTLLRKIESVGYDVFQRRPSLGKLDFVRLYLHARSAFRVGKGEHAATLASPP
jgi:phytoene synthase